MKFSTFAITFRPRDGITDDQVTLLQEWIRKRSLYYHVVTEKTGSERHLHAGIVLRTPITRSNVSMMLSRLFSSLSSQEKHVFLNGIKVMYNRSFIESYLSKDDDTTVVISSLPEAAKLDSYFPPKPDLSSKVKKCSHYYHELESLYHQHSDPATDINTPNIRNFLFKMMYSDRLIPVIRDDKTIIQTARHLVRWLNKAEYSNIQIPPFEQEE